MRLAEREYRLRGEWPAGAAEPRAVGTVTREGQEAVLITATSNLLHYRALLTTGRCGGDVAGAEQLLDRSPSAVRLTAPALLGD